MNRVSHRALQTILQQIEDLYDKHEITLPISISNKLTELHVINSDPGEELLSFILSGGREEGILIENDYFAIDDGQAIKDLCLALEQLMASETTIAKPVLILQQIFTLFNNPDLDKFTDLEEIRSAIKIQINDIALQLIQAAIDDPTDENYMLVFQQVLFVPEIWDHLQIDSRRALDVFMIRDPSVHVVHDVTYPSNDTLTRFRERVIDTFITGDDPNIGALLELARSGITFTSDEVSLIFSVHKFKYAGGVIIPEQVEFFTAILSALDASAQEYLANNGFHYLLQLCKHGPDILGKIKKPGRSLVNIAVLLNFRTYAEAFAVPQTDFLKKHEQIAWLVTGMHIEALDTVIDAAIEKNDHELLSMLLHCMPKPACSVEKLESILANAHRTAFFPMLLCSVLDHLHAHPEWKNHRLQGLSTTGAQDSLWMSVNHNDLVRIMRHLPADPYFDIVLAETGELRSIFAAAFGFEHRLQHLDPYFDRKYSSRDNLKEMQKALIRHCIANPNEFASLRIKQYIHKFQYINLVQALVQSPEFILEWRAQLNPKLMLSLVKIAQEAREQKKPGDDSALTTLENELNNAMRKMIAALPDEPDAETMQTLSELLDHLYSGWAPTGFGNSMFRTAIDALMQRYSVDSDVLDSAHLDIQGKYGLSVSMFTVRAMQFCSRTRETLAQRVLAANNLHAGLDMQTIMQAAREKLNYRVQ